MPDVLARNYDYTRSYVVEAKSTYTTHTCVGKNQIIRQISWVENSIMQYTRSLLAFKFASGHSPTYFFWLMPDGMEPCDITCRNDGRVTKNGVKTCLGHCQSSLEKLIHDDLAGNA